MMLLISNISSAFLETISFFIIYQLCVFRKRDSKLKLGVFFAFIYGMNLFLDKSQLSHTLIFYAFSIVLINGLLKYDVKASAFFALQTFLITLSSTLFTAINFLFLQNTVLDVLHFWQTSQWQHRLFYLLILTLTSLVIKSLHTRMRKKIGLSRALTHRIRVILFVTFAAFVTLTVWLFSFLLVNWSAIYQIKNLNLILGIGYYLLSFHLGYIGYISIYHMSFEQKFNKVSQMAENDPLSGLMSRSAGMNFLRKAFNQTKASGQRLTIAFVDINDLKIVNDKHGHSAGDFLIEKISEVIRSNIRDTDAAMRFGGDEFVLVLPDCPQYRAQEIMTQINVYLNRLNLSEELGFKVGISHGLVEYNSLRHSNALDLIAEADTEMYKNKKKNKHSNR